jgi:hypothetical protein
MEQKEERKEIASQKELEYKKFVLQAMYERGQISLYQRLAMELALEEGE